MSKTSLFLITPLKVFIIIALIGLAVYSNSLSNEFMRDDYAQILHNPLILKIDNIPQFFSGSTFFGGADNILIGRYYKPITLVYFTFVNSLFGLHNYVFHFIQLIFHILNSFLIFLLFKRFLNRKIALFLSATFLIHPINTETVIYISNSQEVLFLFFGLIALLISMKESMDNKDIAIFATCLLLSLLSKETGLLFIPTIIIYVYLFSRKYLKLFLILSAILIFLYVFLRFNAIGTYGLFGTSVPSTPIMKADLLLRLINIPLIAYTYITTFLFPKDLLINQSWIIKSITVKDFIFPLFIDLLIFVLILYQGIFLYIKNPRNFKSYIFFLSIFFLGLIFHLQIIPLDMTVADRWFYFPIIGLLGLIGLFINSYKINNLQTKLLIIFLGIAILLIFSIRVIMRNTDWKNEFTLVKHDIQYSRESYHLEQNLANNYLLNNDTKNAIYHYKKSIKIFPYFTNYTNLGTAYKKINDFDKAEYEYKKALQIGNYYVTYEQLATLYYSNKKDFQKSKEISIKGLRYYKNNQKLLLILTLSYFKMNDLENAKKVAAICFKRSKKINCYKIFYGITNKIPLNGI